MRQLKCRHASFNALFSNQDVTIRRPGAAGGWLDSKMRNAADVDVTLASICGPFLCHNPYLKDIISEEETEEDELFFEQEQEEEDVEDEEDEEEEEPLKKKRKKKAKKKPKTKAKKKIEKQVSKKRGVPRSTG